MLYTNQRNIIIEKIKNNCGVSSTNKTQDALLSALMDILPSMGKYEEESRIIKFDIAFGLNTNVECASGRYYPLQSCIWEEDTEIDKSNISTMIKKVIVLTSDDSDIYVCQKDKRIEIGIYGTDLEKTGTTENSLKENGFVLFHNYLPNKIEMTGKIIDEVICFDFSEEEGIRSKSDFANGLSESVIYRTWKGIFEKVRRNCHGTILLIVESGWSLERDNNFTSVKNCVDIDLTISDKNGADDIHDYSKKLKLFYSMLNFDGITVLDTTGRIRAYNLICKNNYADPKTPGGARHKAYNSLKNTPSNERNCYRAIYFQSQEGEVEFFDYNNPIIESHSFDPMVMLSYTDEPYLEIVKKHKEQRHEFEEQMKSAPQENYTKYLEIKKLLSDLQIAHDGIDNFKNEVGPASSLKEGVLNKYMDTINAYPFIANEIINTVFDCLVGNSYGYSWDAEKHYYDILYSFPKETWESYFDKKHYICETLAWSFSDDNRLRRWKNILANIFAKSPEQTFNEIPYVSEQFSMMYKAYCYGMQDGGDIPAHPLVI